MYRFPNFMRSEHLRVSLRLVTKEHAHQPRTSLLLRSVSHPCDEKRSVVPKVANNKTFAVLYRQYSTDGNSNHNGNETRTDIKFDDARQQREYRVAELRAENALLRKQLREKEDRLLDERERAAKIEEKLKFATDCIQKIRVVLDLRHDAETKFTKFWVQTPQVTTWRRDIQSVILMHSKNCTEEIQETIASFKDTYKTTPHSELDSKLLPASKLKLSVLFDDMFLKWTYVLLHSGDKHVVALREKLSVPDLIHCASNLTYILITVHDATHKEIPKSTLGLGPLTIQMISSTLRDEYAIDEESIQNMLFVLKMKEF